MYEFAGELADTDDSLVVAKVRERLTISKQEAQTLDGERFNPRNLHDLEVRKQYQIEVSNRFAALKNLSDGKDINRTWENITKNIKTSAKERLGLHELKQHKPWFDEECLDFLDQRKQAKMQWQKIQQSNTKQCRQSKQCKMGASRHFRNKKKEYLKAKIEKLETNSKIKNIRDLYMGISDYKKAYQPRTNIVKDEKGDVVTDSHRIWLGGGTISTSY